ncbi:hypothetical protein BS47DRAFT_1394103 [Hydnum rufescens UP504]|uniref:Very-long-chain (3R)-3-hydroxyacyl-CoA dehydratase n=1 Tax=Hydnum rufescens UP504 TaxID=1448309 RepID=A0A9P6AV38_9AGAM|nr:hypothetical protein BS47DRAFT_1394103 [Hydnum rufescens UP504]
MGQWIALGEPRLRDVQVQISRGFSVSFCLQFPVDAGCMCTIFQSSTGTSCGLLYPPINPTAAESPTNTIQHLIAKIPLTLWSATPLTQAKVKIYNDMLPPFLPYSDHANTPHSVPGLKVVVVQSFAILEVDHVLLALLRRLLRRPAMQVASRLTLVWSIVENFAETGTNPIYARMVTAWSIAEQSNEHFLIGVPDLLRPIFEESDH